MIDSTYNKAATSGRSKFESAAPLELRPLHTGEAAVYACIVTLFTHFVVLLFSVSNQQVALSSKVLQILIGIALATFVVWCVNVRLTRVDEIGVVKIIGPFKKRVTWKQIVSVSKKRRSLGIGRGRRKSIVLRDHAHRKLLTIPLDYGTPIERERFIQYIESHLTESE
jgi:hypothetical protein